MKTRRFESAHLGFSIAAALLALMQGPAIAQGPGQQADMANPKETTVSQEKPAEAGPRVTGAGRLEGGKVDRSGRIDVGERVAVVVDGLDGWIGRGDDKWPQVRLVLNGSRIDSLQPLPPMRDLDALVFDLARFDRKNNAAWDQLVQERRGIEVKANITVSFEDGVALPSSVEGRSVILLNTSLAWFAGAFVLVVIVMLVVLAVKFGMLSDSGATPRKGKKPYSLARCQTAWWFVLILCSYLFLSLILGTTVPFPASVLGLMGIASATFVGAEIVNANRGKADTILVSQGFIKDVLKSGADISFHRFQMFVWTLVLGAIFLVRVADNLAMPDFDTTLLGLMGISHGTFLGMKIPEGVKQAGEGVGGG